MAKLGRVRQLKDYQGIIKSVYEEEEEMIRANGGSPDFEILRA